jgi:hypothetical protein
MLLMVDVIIPASGNAMRISTVIAKNKGETCEETIERCRREWVSIDLSNFKVIDFADYVDDPDKFMRWISTLY